jgi:Flp pilus assembly pilin Flp
MKESLMKFWKEEEAIGVVEIILILVVLIALVLIFKSQISDIVTSAFSKANKDTGKIVGK